MIQSSEELIEFVEAPSDGDTISADHLFLFRSIGVPQANRLNVFRESGFCAQVNQRDVIVQGGEFEVGMDDNPVGPKYLRGRCRQIDVMLSQMHKDSTGDDSLSRAAQVHAMRCCKHNVRVDQRAAAFISLLRSQ